MGIGCWRLGVFYPRRARRLGSRLLALGYGSLDEQGWAIPHPPIPSLTARGRGGAKKTMGRRFRGRAISHPDPLAHRTRARGRIR